MKKIIIALIFCTNIASAFDLPQGFVLPRNREQAKINCLLLAKIHNKIELISKTENELSELIVRTPIVRTPYNNINKSEVSTIVKRIVAIQQKYPRAATLASESNELNLKLLECLESKEKNDSNSCQTIIEDLKVMQSKILEYQSTEEYQNYMNDNYKA